MFESILLSGIFCVVILVICITLVFYFKNVVDIRDRYYMDELRKLREEVSELKKFIVTELKEQLNNAFK